ncbi:MAG: DUF3953 domain-containing protein [Methanomassiliicoccaceae archaeon]|jgi:hypothetical protein|nr:DUF3953 domain-containing protein [Methanomassiliicoccaceae archaeon]
MPLEDVFKDSSLVAIIAGAIGLIMIFVNSPVGLLLLGLVALLIGLVNYLKNNNDLLALIAAIFGIIVIICAIWKLM